MNYYFPNKFVINLANRPDRLEQATREFHTHGISNVRRWSAIDGTGMSNGYITDGEMGVLKSHVGLYEYALSEGMEAIMVFEDDVKFYPDVVVFKDYYSQVPPNWQILFVGGNHTQATLSRVDKNIFRTPYSLAMHAYAIRSQTMKLMIERCSQMEAQVDVYLGKLCSEVPAYAICPALAIQRAGHSDIQKADMDYDCLKFGRPGFKRPN